jgi:hypothetical protein
MKMHHLKYLNRRPFSVRVSRLAIPKQNRTKCKPKSLNSSNLPETEVETSRKRRFLYKINKNNRVEGSGAFSVVVNSRINQQKIRMKVVVK